MRTTVELDSDVSRAVEELKREGRGVSEAVNELIRRGLRSASETPAYVSRPQRLGIMIDVSNVAEALEFLEGPEHR